MTPLERTLAVMRGETPDYVPLTIYETKLAGKEYERQIRSRGICMIRRAASHTMDPPNMRYFAKDECVGGRHRQRRTWSTPAGDLTSLVEIVPLTEWTLEYWFKDGRDYDKLAHLFSDFTIAEDYRAAREYHALNQTSVDILTRTQIGYEPMQHIMSTYMGPERFCLEWMDNREQILRLYSILESKNREKYPIEANSPLEIINYGGNVIPEVIGRAGYRDYYMNAYAEAYTFINPRGKLLGTHLDGRNGPIMDLIADSKLDYIEAYDPAASPGVGEAIRMFRGKTLSIHFPSAWDMLPAKEIRDRTVMMIEQADLSRFIIGVTEDMPEDRYPVVLGAIQDGIEAYGRVR